MTSEPPAASTDYLDVFAKVAALGAVLLPAAGVVTRFVAFSAGPPTHGLWELAVSAPLAQLIVTGSLSLFVLLGIAIVWSFGVATSHAGYSHRLSNKTFRQEIVGVFVLLTVFVVFFPGWPAALFFFPLAIVALMMLEVSGRRPTPRTLRQLCPWVVVLMLLASVASGLAGGVVGVGGRHIAFVSGAPLADGRYAALAMEGDTVFLQNCEGKLGQVIAVHQSAIALTALDTSEISFPPSLFEVLFAGKRPSGIGRERFC